MKTKTLVILSVILALFLALSISLATISSNCLIVARAGRLHFVNFSEDLTPGKPFSLVVLNAEEYDVKITAKYSPNNFKYTVSNGIATNGYRFGLDDGVDFERAFDIKKNGAELSVICKYYDVFVMLADLYQTSNIMFVGESDVAFEMTITSGKRVFIVQFNVDMLFTGEQGIYDGNFNVKLDKEGILFGL